MKKLLILTVVLLLASVSMSYGYGKIELTNGSGGWYQAIETTPGHVYEINGLWQGDGELNWCEVLFFNDDGRGIVDQIDAPLNSSVISKVDGWGMNGGMPFPKVGGWTDINNYYYPSGLHTNQITATGNVMYIALKAGTVSNCVAMFDEISVVDYWDEWSPGNKLINGDFLQGEEGWTRWGAEWSDPIIYSTVPEPSSLIALLSGAAAFAGFVVRRKK